MKPYWNSKSKKRTCIHLRYSYRLRSIKIIRNVFLLYAKDFFAYIFSFENNNLPDLTSVLRSTPQTPRCSKMLSTFSVSLPAFFAVLTLCLITTKAFFPVGKFLHWMTFWTRWKVIKGNVKESGYNELKGWWGL